MKLLTTPWEFDGLLFGETETIRFEVGLAETPGELTACFKIRYDTFCVNRGGREPQFPAEDYPDALERGPEDDYAYNLLAVMVKSGVRTPVGTLRLIPCEKGYYIEGSDFGGTPFELPSEHQGEPVTPETTFEVGRWSGRVRHGVLVSMLLAEGALALSKELGRTHWVCIIGVGAVANIRADGWPFNTLIPGTTIYLGKPREACIIPLGDYTLPCRKLTPVMAPTRIREPISDG